MLPPVRVLSFGENALNKWRAASNPQFTEPQTPET